MRERHLPDDSVLSAGSVPARPRRADDAAAPTRTLLALQQSAGNRAVTALVTGGEPPVVARAKRKPAATTPRRSGRLASQTPASRSRLADQATWAGPVFGPHSAVAGGSFVAVSLGPAAGRPTNYGSTPGARQCTAVNRLNAASFLGTKWIKGHLLNDNLGGQGTSRNLTPMSHTTNTSFQGAFEGKVKRALTQAYTHGQRSGTHWYGVRMSVAVKTPGAYTADAAQRAIGQSVRAKAEWIKRERGTSVDKVITKPPWTGPVFKSPLKVTLDCDL